MRRLICALTLMFLIVNFGCGPRPPQGFPKLYQCKITVTKEGKPLANASVILQDESPSGAYASGGKTNASGVAVIRTTQGNYSATGAPEGKYKILLNKPVDIEGKLSDAEVNKMATHERLQYSAEMAKKAAAMTPIIPADLTSVKKTPLNLEVTTAGAEATINVDDYPAAPAKQ